MRTKETLNRVLKPNKASEKKRMRTKIIQLLKLEFKYIIVKNKKKHNTY